MEIKNGKKPEIFHNKINDTTFNRLKELQTVIKKESALKELCKYKNILTLFIIQLFIQEMMQKNKQKINVELYIKLNQKS